ncbi:CHASE domain-containing protein [Lysobacter sp. D1-1-M9]|uniref:CHASE domain-containing protein n=1 Tax=Novilysobacter longmucuonensis TaxID=3098603 RepID=UPI002FCBD540
MNAPADSIDTSQPRPAGTRPSRGHVWALAVLIGSLFIVLTMWRSAAERETDAAEARFVSQTNEVRDLLGERLVNYELVLRGGSALFATVARPSPQQWQAYADGMDIGTRFPGLVGLGYAGYVSHSRLPELQLEWRDSGYGMLEVAPRGVRPHYGPILFLEPRSMENLSAMGYDMYSEPTRHAAMKASLESGLPRLSGAVHLVQDGVHRSTTGLLLYLPVYRTGDSPSSEAARRQSMQGWVYMPFRMEGFVATAIDHRLREERFRIYDTTDGIDKLLFTTSEPAPEDPPAFRHSSELQAYGRTWRLEFDSPPLAIAAPRLKRLQQTLALGIFASLLLYAIAWMLAHTEARAHKLAARMTEDYRRSELRFRSAMHHSAVGEALLDSKGRIVEANPALGGIVGRDPEALVGEQFDGLFEDTETDEAIRGDHNSPRVTDERGVRRYTRRLHREGGLPRHAQLTHSPVPGNVGQDVTGLVQVEDVTERLRAEARVHALNRTLEARVAIRTRELSQANQELETFAYSVSHDLRAPLRAIDGFSRTLAERYGDALDSTGQSYLARVRKAAGRMGELIDALLKMSRVTRSELKVECVDLSRMAADVAEELRAAERDHHPALTIAPGLQVEGDAALLRNLLDNLLGNAWKFTRGREDACIELGAEPTAAGEVEYFVRDNGAGFSQEYVDKLFRPFQRLHSQDQFPGHGIGLASVKRIVERHGGSIRAEGREGEGATFRFVLPDQGSDG